MWGRKRYREPQLFGKKKVKKAKSPTGTELYVKEIFLTLEGCLDVLLEPILMIIAMYVRGGANKQQVCHDMVRPKGDQPKRMAHPNEDHITFGLDESMADIITWFLKIDHELEKGGRLIWNRSTRVDLWHKNFSDPVDLSMTFGDVLYLIGVDWDEIERSSATLWLVATLPDNLVIPNRRWIQHEPFGLDIIVLYLDYKLTLT